MPEATAPAPVTGPADPAAPVSLRPGLHVVRRDAAHVQVGLDPPHRAVLRDDPEVRALLDELRNGALTRAPRSPTARTALVALDAAGLLHHHRRGPRPPRRPTVALHPLGMPLDGMRGLAAVADVVTGEREGVDPDLHVVATTGPLPRARADSWLADGVPHLVLTGTGRPGVLRLGPLVQPTQTACLRCVDAHEGAGDPRRALVLEQLARRPAEPPPPPVVAWALAWAAADVAVFLDGGRPGTWSTTVDLGGGALPRVRTWERHPHCGCCWDELRY